MKAMHSFFGLVILIQNVAPCTGRQQLTAEHFKPDFTIS